MSNYERVWNIVASLAQQDYRLQVSEAIRILSKYLSQAAPWRKDLLALSCLLLAAMLPFIHLLWQQELLIYGSDINFFFPHEIVNRELLANDLMPLWNPYFGAGSPQLGKIQAGMFYPPAMLLRPLPLVTMFNWDAVLHLFFAGSGIYALLRQWRISRPPALGSGLIFMFSGAILPRVIIGHVSVVHTVVWLGWLLWAYDRMLQNRKWGDLLLTVAFTVLVLLGGHPQMSLLILLPLPIYFSVVRLSKMENWHLLLQDLANSILVAFLSLGLVAFHILPYLEWQTNTSRGQGNFINELTQMTANSLNLEYLPTLLAPLLWYSPAGQKTITLTGATHFWEASPFVTVTALLILCLSVGLKQPDLRLQKLLLWCLVITGLVMSMGVQNPLYEWLFARWPLFRAPGRILIWAAFALAGLTGIALDGLRADITSRLKRLKWGQWGALGLLGIGAAGWAIFHFQGQTILESLLGQGAFTEREVAIAQESFPLSIALLLATAVAIYLILWFGRSQRAGQWGWIGGLLLLIFLESAAFSLLLQKPYAVSRLWRSDHPLAQLALPSDEFRIPGYREPPNYLVPTLDHVKNGDEYYALDNLIKQGGQQGLNLLAAGFQANTEPLADPEFRLLQQTNGSYLYEHVGNLPRLYGVSSIMVASDEGEALAAVKAAEFDPQKQGVIILSAAQKPPAITPGEGASATVTIHSTRYRSDTVFAEVTVAEPILLIFSEIAYPGWEATIDGTAAPIYRSNYAFRGIALENPGTYQIEMTFRPRSFQIGLLLTALTLFAILCGSLWHYFRKNIGRQAQ